MASKFREILLEEITDIKRIMVSGLFIISKGLLYTKKILMYKLRCYTYQSGIIETIMKTNTISASLQSQFFLNRLGFINNVFEKSLTLIYECPDKGQIMTIEDFIDHEMDKTRKINMLNEMFNIVYQVKKKDINTEIGCIYPHLFFSFYDMNKHIMMVDYIFSVLLQSSKNNSIRLFSGFFNSINCDEIGISLILICYFFMNTSEECLSIVQIIQKFSDTINQTPEEQAQAISYNIIETEIKEFILDTLVRRNQIDYLQFYKNFRELQVKLKEIFPKGDLKVNEKFFKIIGDTREELSKTFKSKSELEFFFKHMPKISHMSYSKKINQMYFDSFTSALASKKEKITGLSILNQQFFNMLKTYEEKAKEYLKYKIEKVRNKIDLTEIDIEKLASKITNIKNNITAINDFNSDLSLLINLENDGTEIINRLKIFSTQIIPRLFQEYWKVIENLPKTIQIDNNINFLCLYPQLPNILPNYYIHVQQNTDKITILQQETNSQKQTQQVISQFTCIFNVEDLTITKFPKNCQWLKYASFVIVNGGENSHNESIASTLVIDLTQEEGIKIFQKEDMLTPKIYHSLCKYNSYFLISVGGDGTSAEMYSIFKDSWEKLPDLNEERKNGMLCLFNEKDLYYFGGTKPTNTIEHLTIIDFEKSNNYNSAWNVLKLNKEVTFTERAFIKYGKTNTQQILILGGFIESMSANENNNNYTIDFLGKTVGQYKTKITFNLTYRFFEHEMVLVDNSYIQVCIDDHENPTLVSFAKGLFIVD